VASGSAFGSNLKVGVQPPKSSSRTVPVRIGLDQVLRRLTVTTHSVPGLTDWRMAAPIFGMRGRNVLASCSSTLEQRPKGEASNSATLTNISHRLLLPSFTVNASIHTPTAHQLLAAVHSLLNIAAFMRSFFSTTLLFLLSSLHVTFSQELEFELDFLSLHRSPGCQYPSTASSSYTYFTSPNESDFLFSIYTEWTKWYPSILRNALEQAGFSLEPTGGKNQTSACGWTGAGSVTVGSWDRGTVTFKDVTVPAKAPHPRPKPLDPAPNSLPEHPNPHRPPVSNMTAAHVSRQLAPQPLSHDHPLSYLLSYPLGTTSSPKQTNRTLRLPRNINPQRFSQVQTPIIPPLSHRTTPRSPRNRPKKQTLDLIRTILLTNSPEADIALFLMEIVGTIVSALLLFCILVLASRILGRMLYPLPNPEDEEGDIELESVRDRSVDSAGTLVGSSPEPIKPEHVRVVPKGDERIHVARTKVGVPRSSSVYSRSVDGVTLF